jgi:hypothetical protein
VIAQLALDLAPHQSSDDHMLACISLTHDGAMTVKAVQSIVSAVNQVKANKLKPVVRTVDAAKSQLISTFANAFCTETKVTASQHAIQYRRFFSDVSGCQMNPVASV